MNIESVLYIMQIIQKHQLFEYVVWDKDLNFYVDCSDVFYWATSEGEPLEMRDVALLEDALKDCHYVRDDAIALYACRKRGMRPQKPFYAYIEDGHQDLFNACGPERTE